MSFPCHVQADLSSRSSHATIIRPDICILNTISSSSHSQGWTWPKMGSVLFATLFVALQFATGLANPDSKRLYDDLLSNYNRLIRPVGNNSDRLTVKMGLRLSQLIDVVSKAITMIITALESRDTTTNTIILSR